MALYSMRSKYATCFPCYKHDDCRENHELGRACAAAELARTTRELATVRVPTTTSSDPGTPGSMLLVLVESYAGCVVELGVDYNVRVMSDVYDDVPYAIVRAPSGAYVRVDRYTGPGFCREETDFWDALRMGTTVLSLCSGFRDTVDAPAEMIAAYHAEQAAKLAEFIEHERQRAEQAAAEERARPRKGRKVRVVKGRKVPIGTEGVVIWEGDGNWGRRIGVKDAKGDVHWTAASNAVAL